MTHAKKTLVAMAIALAAGVSPALPGPGSDAVTVPDSLIVYVDDARLDVARLEARIGGGYDFDDATEIRTIAVGKSHRTYTAYSITPPSAGDRVSARAERTWLRRIDRVQGVRYVEALSLREVKGQPFTIPILDGDLDMGDLSSQAAMVQVNRGPAHSIATGGGLVVAVLDGGFDLGHDALAGRLTAARWDALDHDDDPEDHGDGFDGDFDGEVDSLVGHGTFVASLVLACAPDARILPIRVLDDEGWGHDLAVAMAIDFAVQNEADVINMSLLLPDVGPAAKAALQSAVASGIPIVTAAGNEASGLLDDPFVRARSITVGAVDHGDAVIEWSANGPAVDVFAPGQDVAGALRGPTGESAYGYWAGTSFASAVATAGAALVRDAKPELDLRDVRERVVERGHSTVGALPATRKRVDLFEAIND